MLKLILLNFCGSVRLGTMLVQSCVQCFIACLFAINELATVGVCVFEIVIYCLLVSSNLCCVWLTSQGCKGRLTAGGESISTIAVCNNGSISCFSSPTPMYPPTYLEPGIGYVCMHYFLLSPVGVKTIITQV